MFAEPDCISYQEGHVKLKLFYEVSCIPEGPGWADKTGWPGYRRTTQVDGCDRQLSKNLKECNWVGPYGKGMDITFAFYSTAADCLLVRFVCPEVNVIHRIDIDIMESS